MITVPTRIDLIAMLPAGSHIAEVGVYRGEFSHAMLELPNIGKLWLVDPWSDKYTYDELPNKDHEDNYLAMLDAIKGHASGDRVEIKRMSSIFASLDFKDESLDGLFLDACHKYESVLADLRAWNRVIKGNGKIFGHDFTRNETYTKNNWGVIEAVEKFCSETGWKLKYTTSEEFSSFGLERV